MTKNIEKDNERRIELENANLEKVNGGKGIAETREPLDFRKLNEQLLHKTMKALRGG